MGGFAYYSRVGSLRTLLEKAFERPSDVWQRDPRLFPRANQFAAGQPRVVGWLLSALIAGEMERTRDGGSTLRCQRSASWPMGWKGLEEDAGNQFRLNPRTPVESSS